MKKGGLSSGDVAALYKYRNVTFDVKVDTASNVSCFASSLVSILYYLFLGLVHATHPRVFHIYPFFCFSQISTIITLNDIVPSTKTIASVKFPDHNSGKVKWRILFI